MPTNKNQTGREDASSPEELAQRRQERHESRANATYRKFLKHAAVTLSVTPERAEEICIAVISALEQRVPADEMSDLLSQLPSRLRELIATSDTPTDRLRARDIGQAEFLAMVARDLNASPDEVEGYVRGVFQLLSETVSSGEIVQVIHMLPANLRALWPASVGPGPT